MSTEVVKSILDEMDNCVSFTDKNIAIRDGDLLRSKIGRLTEISALETCMRQGMARYLTRVLALEAGILPASIHDFYIARGNGEVPPNFAVPAINLRALSFHAARAVFRSAKKIDAAAFIFEIARSEIGYTDQRPAEYATNILAAAISEDFKGPIFIQGDHFQISSKRYGSDPDKEISAVQELSKEAIKAGFFNIDIDTSTLVDLDQPTVLEQQAVNSRLTASFTRYIRDLEPRGVTISIGGEIGEVGGKNSTEDELRAYMDGYISLLQEEAPGMTGLSKISIQTGTSHGGVVLPDGTIAEVSVDFDTMLTLSRIARDEYAMAGAVQHGASTLPQEAFSKFVESEACEVHLATGFQNMMYDRLPEDLLKEIYTYLEENHSDERKPDMTDDQFFYKTRKRAIGPHKSQIWALPKKKIDEICIAWEEQFDLLFDQLNIGDTRKYVDKHVTTIPLTPSQEDYLDVTKVQEEVTDLAD